MATRNRIRILLLALVVLSFPRAADSCGPMFLKAVFTRPDGPDKPMSRFAEGRLGVVLPTWWRAYLAVAYRYLDGRPLTAAERISLQQHWDVDRRLDPYTRTDALRAWLSLRQKYAQAAPPANLSRYSDPKFEYPLNCNPPAFRTATDTLQRRARRYGAASPELQQWIAAQDLVFENCHAEDPPAGSEKFIPASLPGNARPLRCADRAYQIAAAYFYQADWQRARREFDAIAHDKASPWQAVSAYMVARSLIREAAAAAPQGQTYDLALLRQARNQLQLVMRDPQYRAMQDAAREMLDLVLYRLEPQEYRQYLAASLASGKSGSAYGQQLVDYTMALNGLLDGDPPLPGVNPWEPTYERRLQEWRNNRYSALETLRADKLTDWLLTMQSGSEAAIEHSLARWRQTRSLAWLVAAASKVNGTNAAAAELLQAAAGVDAQSPAFATLAYQRARLLRESGKPDAARELVETILGHSESLPLSATNLFRAELLRDTNDMERFTGLLGSTPVLLTYDNDEEPDPQCYDPTCNLVFYGSAAPALHAKLAPQFDTAAAQVLNARVSTDVLAQLAQSPALPENLRRRLALATWARAAFLDQPEIARAVSGAAEAAEPRLKSFIDAYDAAKNSDERLFAAVFAVLHFPGLRPFVDGPYPRTTPFAQMDELRDNWWCRDAGTAPQRTNYDKAERYPGAGASEGARPPADFPGFLTAAQRERAEEEWKRLNANGIAGRFLARIALDWGRAHPGDPRVPEALHYAVRATHLGCGDGKPNGIGGAAFRLLHRNYPNSEWAKQTPYWYR